MFQRTARTLSPLILPIWIAAAGCSHATDDAEGAVDPARGDTPVEGELVATADGQLRGSIKEGVRILRGVPFAAAPVGERRWRPPAAHEGWDGERDATAYGPSCPQHPSLLVGYGPETSEDCLTLNVWSPWPQPEQPAPVLVFFHGGGFIWGGSSQRPYASAEDVIYDGSTFARKHGVVVVTVNYRLGALGYMAHEKLSAEDPNYPSSGNYGIEDQRAALRWVQENIAQVGGDPNNVTISGQSAGAVGTYIHLASPTSEGLFHKVIAQSGTASTFLPPLRGDSVLPYPVDSREAQGQRMAEALGCTDDEAVLECMRSKSTDELLDALPTREWIFYGPGELWLPNVDGLTLTGQIHDLFLAGEFQKVPVVIGTTRDEGSLFTVTARDMDEAAFFSFAETQFEERAQRVMEVYSPANYESPADAMTQAIADYAFVCDAQRVARAMVANQTPVYRYEFAHVPSFTPLPFLGSFHASDLFYVFNTNFGDRSLTEAEQDLSVRIVDYWSAFMHGGDPNAAGQIPWPEFGAAEEYLVLQEGMAVESGLAEEICEFWNEIGP